MKIVRNIIGEVLRRISFYIYKYKCLYNKNIYIDSSVKMYFTKGNLILGNDIMIGAFNVIYALDSYHSKIKGILSIGEGTSIGEFNNIRAAGGSITIGSNCLISQYVSIVASNHNIKKGFLINAQGWDESKTDVFIGNDVWIGANTVILPGVSLGNGCVVAAGCVVTKSFPDYSIIAGLPGKLLKTRI